MRVPEAEAEGICGDRAEMGERVSGLGREDRLASKEALVSAPTRAASWLKAIIAATLAVTAVVIVVYGEGFLHY